jgi:NADH-quinone oxidoreductase subunit G
MSDDIVNIEVNGKPVEARSGQMIIEVTDEMRNRFPRA